MKLFKYKLLCLCLPFFLLNSTCDDDSLDQSSCGIPVVIDDIFYNKAVSDDFELIDFEISDDCFSVNIGSSGCDGETWSLVLVDSGLVAESSPEQRFLKLVFTNTEECLPALTQTRIFNLSNLRLEGTNEIVLNIEGIEESIVYFYP